MTTKTIRIDRRTHQRLASLSRAQHRPMIRIVAEAVERYEEELFWAKAREGYERLNANPADRAAYDAEIALWDTALMDGLAAFPYDEESHHGAGM